MSGALRRLLMTPPTLRYGLSGDAVLALQARLNLAFPKELQLAIDGIFGPLTQQRTIKFQRSRNLTTDGVVGPHTWAALFAIVVSAPPRTRFSCDNGNPAHRSFSARIASNLPVMSAKSASLGLRATSAGVPPTISVAGMTLTPLIGTTHEATARSVYGSSLQYDRIFLSAALGAQGRPFTVAVPVLLGVVFPGLPAVNTTIQVMNVGTAPLRSDIIHELGHVWQSQHHVNPVQYMANCVACQAKAVALNLKIGVHDLSVALNKEFPGQFPFSAYAYERGKGFGEYGGEQIAEQIEKDEASIRAHVSGTAAGAVDGDNVIGLQITNIKVADRRLPTVFI